MEDVITVVEESVCGCLCNGGVCLRDITEMNPVVASREFCGTLPKSRELVLLVLAINMEAEFEFLQNINAISNYRFNNESSSKMSNSFCRLLKQWLAMFVQRCSICGFCWIFVLLDLSDEIVGIVIMKITISIEVVPFLGDKSYVNLPVLRDVLPDVFHLFAT